MIIALKFILSFCALSYEFLYAQGLSAFLDNTVLRYSTTIGIYMAAMGVGALLSGRVDAPRAAVFLWRTEIALALTGTVGLAGMFLLSGQPVLIPMLWAYVCVCSVGVLTGMELPLFLKLGAGQVPGMRTGSILAADYAGAFIGTLGFVFFFYPVMGLVAAVVIVGLLNAVAALAAAWFWRRDMGDDADNALAASLILVAIFAGWCLMLPALESQLAQFYMRGLHGH